MDFLNRILQKAILILLISGLGALMLPISALAESDILKNFSFDDCDPFEARALVMDVNGKRAQLVAAEQIIYVVDLSLGDQQLITELTDAEGRQLDFSAFRRGQWVYVKGFKHIDGGVIASLVQLIDAPERQTPVLRKISKNNRNYKRIRRPVSAVKQ